MRTLPDGLVHFKSSPEFDENTVPKGLLKSHTTKAGAWAKIVILEGSLDYVISEPEEETITLTPNQPGVIEPTISHAVKPNSDVRFCIEFYR